MHLNRTEWMSGKTGLMIHYLPPGLYNQKGIRVADIDEAADSFDISAFIKGLERAGAEWLIFTIGQNKGVYVSHNSVLEAAGARCTRRDLLLELAQAVKDSGRRFIAYLPAEVAINSTIRSAMGWEGGDYPYIPQDVFHDRYEGALREWAERLGTLLDGWWLDGAWQVSKFTDEQWRTWGQALRAGNPAAAVALNTGAFCVNWLAPICDEVDYQAGECEVLTPEGLPYVGREVRTLPLPPVNGKYEDGTTCLWHVLLPVDALWMHTGSVPDFLPPSNAYSRNVIGGQLEMPIYSDAQLKKLREHYCGKGGAVSFNVATLADGTMNPVTLEQLHRVTKG